MTVVLDHCDATNIADMADMLWRGQTDRHGTDEPGAPLTVSLSEADAAFHIALALAQLFGGGLIARANV